MRISPPTATVKFEVTVTPQEAENLAADSATLITEIRNRGDGDHFSPETVKILEVLQLLPQQFS